MYQLYIFAIIFFIGGARLSSTNTTTVVTISENDDIHGVFEFATGGRLLYVEEPQSIPLTVELVLERLEGAEGVVRITWEAVIRDGISADDDISVTRGELLFQSQERSKTFSIQVIYYTIILYTLLTDYTVYIYSGLSLVRTRLTRTLFCPLHSLFKA